MKNKLLVIFILLSATNRLLEFSGIHIPFISSYMDDVLCIPIVLGIMLLIFRKFIMHDEYRFPIIYILFTVALYSFIFEYYLPLHSARFTSDKWDVLAYAIGGNLFQYLFNKKADHNDRLLKYSCQAE